MAAPVAAAATNPALWWAAAGIAALGAIKGISASGVAKAQAQANTRVSAANMEAETQLRTVGNQAKAGTNALEMWSQSVNNARRQKQTGAGLEAATVNAYRQFDIGTSGRFSGSIRDAEQAGGQAAAAAASGVEGSVVDRVAAASKLRRQIGEEMSTRATGQVASDASRRMGVLTSQLLSGLDTRTQMAGLDYNRSVSTTFNAPGTMRGAIEGILGSGAVQTALAGMQAGNPTATPTITTESAGGLATRR